MPKMKTKKAAAKRYHVTGTGKVRYKKQGLRHILTKKNAKRKRRLRLPAILSPVETKRVKQLLPVRRASTRIREKEILIHAEVEKRYAEARTPTQDNEARQGVLGRQKQAFQDRQRSGHEGARLLLP